MYRTASVIGIVLAMAAVAWAQERGRGRGFGGDRGGPAMLLAIPQVRSDLKMTDEQNKQIDALLSEQRQAFQAAFGDFNPQEFQNLSEEERGKRRAEIQQKMAELGEKNERAVAKILDEKQQERLKQIHLQVQGVGALSRPEVAGELGLTADQQQKIRSIQQSAFSSRSDFDFRNATPEQRQQFIEQMRERREKANADILAVLSDEQKNKWQRMQGAKIDLPQGGFGAGGRGRGPDRRNQN